MVRRTPTSLRRPLADRMREMAESHGMGLSKLLKDSILIYSSQVDAGYEPGTSLARSSARRQDE